MFAITRNRAVILASALLLFVAGFVVLYGVSRSTAFQFFGEIHDRVETSQRVVALTFDDGPTRGRTDEILQILAEENVRATFFLIGSDIESNRAEAEKLIAARHEIGNHSYSHKRMVFVTPNFVREEIEATDLLIREAGYTGEITFRPPYGKKLFVLPYYLSQNDRKTITWDVEPETFFERSEDIVEHTLDTAKSGSIILLHVAFDSRRESMKSVRPIIRGLREKGFEFRTVSELLASNGRG